MKKVLLFGIAGAIGGASGALLGEPVLRLMTQFSDLGTSAATAAWTAVVAVALALALVLSQNRYLQRSPLSTSQAAVLLVAGLTTGGAAGGIAQWLYTLISGRFAEQAEAFEGLAEFGGWLILGGLLGWGLAFFIPNLPRFRAAIAGAIGGLAAAWFRMEIARLLVGSDATEGLAGRVAGAAILGLFIGAIVAWVDAAFREAWVDVFYGSEKEKRSVRLGADEVTIGSDGNCTLKVFEALPIALRYKFDGGVITCDDLASGKITAVRPGDRRQVAKATVCVGAAGCNAMGATAAPGPVSYSLRLSSGRSISLSDGARLGTADLPGVDAPRATVLAEVARNPQNPAVLGLKNLTSQAWRVTLANGGNRQVDPGRSLALAHGNRLEFGGIKGVIQESFGPPARSSINVPKLLTALAALALLSGIAARAWVVANHRIELSSKQPPPSLSDAVDTSPEEERDEPPELPTIPPPPEPPPVDPVQRIAVKTTAGGSFGIVTITGNPEDPTDDNKKLTYSDSGTTNNVRVWIDGDTPNFGSTTEGRLVRKMSKVSERRYECEWESNQINVLETLELVGGEVSRRTDNVAVQFRLLNRDTKAHNVGLRVMLDTLIGDNDGVPFLVPGQAGVVHGPQVYTGQAVPHFIQAIEFDNLDRPGVVVNVGIKGTGDAPPSQVILTHWPGSNAAWDYDRSAPFRTDTAVGLYYEPSALPAGGTRTLSFLYGLGTLTTQKDTNMSFVAKGPFRSGGVFYLMLLVQDAKKDDVVRLSLPSNLSLDGSKPDNQLEKPVPYGDKVTSLSWLLKIDPGFFGDAEVSAQLQSVAAGGRSTSVEARGRYLVEPREARLILRPQKPPLYLGKAFWVSALVQNPRKDQKVELQLPDGLKFARGHTAVKEVAAAPAGERHAQIDWLVRGETTVTAELKLKLTPDNLTDSVTVTIEPSPLIK